MKRTSQNNGKKNELLVNECFSSNQRLQPMCLVDHKTENICYVRVRIVLWDFCFCFSVPVLDLGVNVFLDVNHGLKTLKTIVMEDFYK
jgi:hypothetical protein